MLKPYSLYTFEERYDIINDIIDVFENSDRGFDDVDSYYKGENGLALCIFIRGMMDTIQMRYFYPLWEICQGHPQASVNLPWELPLDINSDYITILKGRSEDEFKVTWTYPPIGGQTFINYYKYEMLDTSHLREMVENRLDEIVKVLEDRCFELHKEHKELRELIGRIGSRR